MISTDYIGVLLLAPVAALVAWLLATRGRRGRWIAGAGAALSAALIVVALAGIFAGETSALRVFLVDVSASTRGAATVLLPRIRAEAARLKRTDRIAIVAFGREARVLLPPTPVAELPAELPAPVGVDQDGTSVERALRLALDLFPRAADFVLVTDGRENAGDATALAAEVAASGVAIHSQTISVAPAQDAWVEAVHAPHSVPAGQPIHFEVLVGAMSPLHGKLVLLLNGRELARPEPIDVVTRRTVLARRVVVKQPGLHTLTARLLCPDDKTSENNEASAAVRVRGKLNVTHVSGGDDRALAAVLAGSDAITLHPTRPDALAATNQEMLKSDVIVLDDVSAKQLGAKRIAWLRRFVMDAGRGLVVFGGKDSFGPGGYAGTALARLLPVDPDPHRRAAKPSSAVIVADRSGSMAEMIGGRQKIEFVREAVLRAGTEFGARAGDRSDELSVVAFNQAPEVLLERRRVRSREGAAALRAAVGKIFPSGRTRIGPALDAARAVLARSTLKRHIILVSDGRSQDPLDGAKIAAQMTASRAVLSVLATGTQMNGGLRALKTAAGATKGRFVMLASISELPAAMARETRTIAGALIREGEVAVERNPDSSWRGTLPAPRRIGGYVLTGARPEAPPDIVAAGAPILASWRRGLGYVVACTTSLDHWAAEWADRSPDFLRGLVLWAGEGHRPQQLIVRLVPEERHITVLAESAVPLDGRQLVASFFRPDGAVSKVEMRQTGRLRYQCVAEAGKAGTYVAKVSGTGDAASSPGRVLGEGHVTVGYSAEWRPGGDASVARRLSHVTSGRVLKSLRDLPPLEPSTSGSGARRDLAWILLLAAAATFLLASLR